MKKLNQGLADLVALLNDGQYHDGTTMGEQLHITRSAVWKTIQKLERYGVKIDSIKGKGYALGEPLALLDKKIIQSKTRNKKIDIHLFESIGSTNDYLRKLVNKNDITVCLAEQQTKGRGRFQREWYSPFGQNIYLSCAYPFQKDVSTLSGLSLVVSLAVVKTLVTDDLQKMLLVKWPNDILYDQQKLSGNLIEIQAESHSTCRAIIGIGINVNMTQDEHHISQAWTSLKKITGHAIDRNALCASLIKNLVHYLRLFEAKGLSFFIDKWEGVDYLKNKKITLQSGREKSQGKVIGIDEVGHLRLKLKEGIRSFSSGDITLVK